MFKEDDLLLRDTPVEEGVGDFVVRVTEVRHNVEYGAVVYNGIIVVSDSPTFPVGDEFWLGAANNYTLYKGEEALPPVVDTKFVFGDNEIWVEASNSYVEDEEVFLGLFPIRRNGIDAGISVHISAEDALDLAHDLRRQAMQAIRNRK
ncbi:hypothetical protein [Citrobacter phage Tr1]|nr:hypothetical protein [Citrobacter phage Tr1]